MDKKSIISYLLFVCFILSSGLIWGQPPIGDEGFAVIKEAYLYDKNLPLTPIISETKKYTKYTRHKIYFAGVHQQVGAYLAVPAIGKSPFPVVLLIAGMGGSKDSWWGKGNWNNGLETTEALMAQGFAVFTIDAAMHGERADSTGIFPAAPNLRKNNLMFTIRDMIMQTVQDYMRGLDYLETREDIQTDKVGVYGLSMGGAVTFILSALDNRIHAAVAGLTVVYGNSNSAVNAYNFAPHIQKKAIFMLMGDKDGYYTLEKAKALFDALGGNENKLIIFEGGHKIPVAYVPAIANWFEEELLTK